jgi:hypothetical protein
MFVTTSNFLQAGGEVGELTIEHNTIENGGPMAFLYSGGVWRAGEAYRAAAYAVERLTIRNNLAYGNNGGLLGDASTPGSIALQQYAPGYVWTHNVLAGLSASYTYPSVTWRPTIEEFYTQFIGGTYLLLASSSYRAAATDGQDLGAQLSVQIQPPRNLTVR